VRHARILRKSKLLKNLKKVYSHLIRDGSHPGPIILCLCLIVNNADTTGKSRRKSRDDDRNTLLVTGLSSQTAATEIKAVFKKHGKVVSSSRKWEQRIFMATN
jgi:hypothetical protein